MLRAAPPKGPYISRQTALYTAELNKMFIKIVKRCLRKIWHTRAPSAPAAAQAPGAIARGSRMNYDNAIRPLSFTEKLRGNHDDQQQVHAIGGMRRTAQSMKKDLGTFSSAPSWPP